MLLVTLLMGVAAIVAIYWGAKISMAFGHDVCGALFRTVQTFSQMEVGRFGTPSLVRRTTNDVQQVQMVGRIIEQGNHRELLERGGFYHDLYESQFVEALEEAS